MKKYIFSDLFEEHQLSLFRYLMQMSRDRQIAEDLLQETFYRAMVSLSVKNMTEPRAWLFKVARNLYIDWTRKIKSERKLVERIQQDYSPVSVIGNPEGVLEAKARQEHINEVLLQLPERYRTIIYLREVQELTYKELMTAMALTENQVKVTLHRARGRFRDIDSKLKGGVNHER